jgi:hypothetical protein
MFILGAYVNRERAWPFARGYWAFTGVLVDRKRRDSPEGERYWQQHYCGEMEFKKPIATGGKIDCLGEEIALEITWAHTWAKAIGQSLYYAAATHRKPVIVLLCASSQEECQGSAARAKLALKFVNTTVPIRLCSIENHQTLEDCPLQ